MLKKVLSGAQTGVDQAALRAAREAGIPTGGFVPKGCRTLEGDRPHLIALYGLTEMESRYYTKRTEANVREADATLIIARKVQSPGTRLTIRCCDRLKKPYVLADMAYFRPGVLADWIERNAIRVLNVAGNSEQTAPGIGELAECLLRQVFAACREGGDA